MLSRMKSPLAARIVSVGAAIAALAACSAPQPAPQAACAPLPSSTSVDTIASAPPPSVPASPAASASVAAPALPPPRDAIANVNGLKMHYRRQGTGPTLVLLHGGSASAELCWGPAFAFFAPSFDVIAPDQMGHGRTADDPKRAMSYHAMAEDTATLLEQLGVKSASLVGWSDGGILALDIAIHHPALAAKIVTSGANYTPDGTSPQARAWIRTSKPADWPALLRDDYAKLSPDGAEHFGPFLTRLKTMWLSQPNMTTKQLATIKAPALVVAGDHDMIRSEHTLALAQAIPGAELAILPNAGHGVVLEDAPRFNAVVLAFLNEKPKPAESH